MVTAAFSTALSIYGTIKCVFSRIGEKFPNVSKKVHDFVTEAFKKYPGGFSLGAVIGGGLAVGIGCGIFLAGLTVTIINPISVGLVLFGCAVGGIAGCIYVYRRKNETKAPEKVADI